MKSELLKKISVVIMAGTFIFLPGCRKWNKSNSASNHVGYQLNMPSDGEEVAVVSTNMGTFKMRFFPDVAPKAVENFKTLSKNEYYNGIRFHRVIENFMIQGGDPEGNGQGGESIWGKDFEDEFSDKLFNITGSVAMANRGPNTNGSQFFINYQSPDVFPGWEKLGRSLDMSKINSDIKKLYEKYGGNPHLDGYYSASKKGHTVFGQVFEGLDVIEKISKVETDENDKPKEDIKIEYISIEVYGG